MKDLQDHSVDMILCDLPYQTTRNKWDSMIPLEELWRECDRVIKPNGAQGSHSDNYGAYTQPVTVSNGERYPIDILQFKRDSGLHPTQKPVSLCEYLIKTYTNENEIVLDTCMGSGTTGVACINTNRDFIGYELEDDYFTIAKERLEALKNWKHQ